MTEVLSQGMMFFIAGYDTTATSIAFLLYNLSLNPEIQEKLYEEIMDTAGDQVNTFYKYLFVSWICMQTDRFLFNCRGQTNYTQIKLIMFTLKQKII